MRRIGCRDPGGLIGVVRIRRGLTFAGIAPGFEQGVEGSDVIVTEAFSLVFAPDDVPEGFEILEGWGFEIGPVGFGLEFGLEAPAAAKAVGADFAFFTVGRPGFPDMNVPHEEEWFLVEPETGLATISGALKEIGKILTYLCAVLLGGALLAPSLYWAAQALMDAGYLGSLRHYGFQKYLNRSVLIAAFVLLWPVLRWLRIQGRSELQLEPDPHRGRHLLQGLGLGAGAMGLLAGAYLAFGVYELEKELPWLKLGSAALSAVVVSLIEEFFFRGGINGLFRRSLSAPAALWATSLLFAAVHFIKPDPSVKVGQVTWSSGLELMPHSFHQFAEPLLFLGGFATLLTFGLVLGLAAWRTRALWMSIGIHAGLVFVKLGFEKFTDRKMQLLPWVGPELQVGLAPVVVLLGAGVLVHFWAPKTSPNQAPGA